MTDAEYKERRKKLRDIWRGDRHRARMYWPVFWCALVINVGNAVLSMWSGDYWWIASVALSVWMWHTMRSYQKSVSDLHFHLRNARRNLELARGGIRLSGNKDGNGDVLHSSEIAIRALCDRHQKQFMDAGINMPAAVNRLSHGIACKVLAQCEPKTPDIWARAMFEVASKEEAACCNLGDEVVAALIAELPRSTGNLELDEQDARRLVLPSIEEGWKK